MRLSPSRIARARADIELRRYAACRAQSDALRAHVEAIRAELAAAIEAIRKVLRISGMSLSDIDLVEINEAFAAVGLASAKQLGLDADKAVALMLAQPSMIKRPVLDLGDRRLVGFKPETYAPALT